jgi:hypothetical protein
MPIVSAAVVSIIENNSISQRTQKRYASNNFAFILWLREHHPEMLRPCFCDDIASVPNNMYTAQCLQDLHAIVNRWLDNMK